MKRTRVSIIIILPIAMLFLSAGCIAFPPKEDGGDRKPDTNVMDIRTMELPLAFECGSQTYQPIQQIAIVHMIENISAIIASPARGFYVGEGESNMVDDRLYYWSGEEWVLVDDPQIVKNHIQTMTAERDRGIFYIGVGKRSEAGKLLFSTDGGIHWDPVPGWTEQTGAQEPAQASQEEEKRWTAWAQRAHLESDRTSAPGCSASCERVLPLSYISGRGGCKQA